MEDDRELMTLFSNTITEICSALSVLSEEAIRRGWFASLEDFERQVSERESMIKRVAEYRQHLAEEQDQ